MNRNNNSRFSQVPVDINIQRSRFERPFDHKTTFNAGELIPIFCDEVLPGDTFEVDTSYVVRMSTPIFPVMDNAFLDTYFFFVPNRLIWEHWEAFNGQNDDTYWTQPVEYNIPQLIAPEGGWDPCSLADYFGIPTKVDGFSVSQLPFRAYVKIFNDWFRDQNVMNPAYISLDDSDRTGRLRDQGVPSAFSGITDAMYGGRPLPVSKFHDYFTSALPQPQKGPSASVGLHGVAPVLTSGHTHGKYDPIQYFNGTNNSVGRPLQLAMNGGSLLSDPVLLASDGDVLKGVSVSGTVDGSSASFYPTNLWADFSDKAPQAYAASILVNDMRLAFQIQKLYEKDARGGTRYVEILKAHFNVDSPDGRLQRSEYLGGDRRAININQVLQNSATDVSNASTPLGTAGAYSLTHNSGRSFVKSFTEHGWIIGVACVRTSQTYQQGLNRMFSRKRRFDFYWPSLANIGEQAILKKELIIPSSTPLGVNTIEEFNDSAFGYQEAWAEYRYHPSFVSGAFRSNVDGTLDSWHYAVDFESPRRASEFALNSDFIIQSGREIDRTLAVSSELADQFIGDFYFKSVTTRPMPLYSVPGLIDHH